MENIKIVEDLFRHAIAALEQIRDRIANDEALRKLKRSCADDVYVAEAEVKFALNDFNELPAVKAIEERIDCCIKEGRSLDACQLCTALGFAQGRIAGSFGETYELRSVMESIHKRRSDAAARNAKLGAKLTSQQWSVVMGFVRSSTQSGLSAAAASRQASAQLMTGQLIEGLHVDVKDNTIAKRWSDRGFA